MTTVETYKELGIEASPRVVLHADNTESIGQMTGIQDAQYDSDVDALFGTLPSYWIVKKEKPAHRMMLWLTLQGHKTKEIAAALRVTPQTVLKIQKQPWFLEGFKSLALEMGKDVMKTFLETQALPAIMRVVDLAQAADSDAVRLAANREILDRFLGKPVVRAEVNETKTVDVTITDAAKLMDERKRLDEQLRANGLLTGTN